MGDVDAGPAWRRQNNGRATGLMDELVASLPQTGVPGLPRGAIRHRGDVKSSD
jgi:hypothetical protein